MTAYLWTSIYLNNGKYQWIISNQKIWLESNQEYKSAKAALKAGARWAEKHLVNIKIVEGI